MTILFSRKVNLDLDDIILAVAANKNRQTAFAYPPKGVIQVLFALEN